MSSTGAGWAQLRQQARSLESQTEDLFHTYSQFSTSSSISPEPSNEEKRIETQISNQLDKRDSLISQLTRLLDSDAAASSSATGGSSLKQNNLARHREILSEHRRELARLRGAVGDARARANLLSSVRADVSAYRAAADPGGAEADYMLDERRRLDRSTGIADSVISQAYAINDSMRQQSETLASINRRIVGAAAQVPGINSLMTRIGAKKRRDGIILGSFIAFCFLVVFFFS